MGGVEDGEPRPAVGGAQHLRDVEGLALAPGLEGGRGEEVVERHHQPLPLLAREDALHGQGADLLEGRIGHRGDQGLEVEALAGAPGVLDEVGEEDRLLGLERVGVDLQEAQEARPRCPAISSRRSSSAESKGTLGASSDCRTFSETPAFDPGRVDRGLVRLDEGRDVLARKAPLARAPSPGRGGVGRGRLHVLAVAARGLRVDPGLERRGVELLEEEEQVAEVALRVDGDHRRSPGGGLPRGGRSPARSCPSPSSRRRGRG